MCCCCCCGSPNQTHIALTVNTGILFILFLIMACVMVSSTNDYKIVKEYIDTYEKFDFSNWSNYLSRRLDLICTYENYQNGKCKEKNYENYCKNIFFYNKNCCEKYSLSCDLNKLLRKNSDDIPQFSFDYSDGKNHFKYASWFKNLKSIELGIIVTRVVVAGLLFGFLIFCCYLECNKKLPKKDIFYTIFIVVYIFQIVFHIIFAILSIYLGVAELLAILQYGLLLASGAKISGPILKRGATQITFTGFFFVYQLVFICLIVPVFTKFKNKELNGQDTNKVIPINNNSGNIDVDATSRNQNVNNNPETIRIRNSNKE